MCASKDSKLGGGGGRRNIAKYNKDKRRRTNWMKNFATKIHARPVKFRGGVVSCGKCRGGSHGKTGARVEEAEGGGGILAKDRSARVRCLGKRRARGKYVDFSSVERRRERTDGVSMGNRVFQREGLIFRSACLTVYFNQDIRYTRVALIYTSSLSFFVTIGKVLRVTFLF